MEIATIFIILLGHYVSDFLLQNNLMAENKSKNVYWLATHCVVYTLGMFFSIFIANTLSFITINSYYYLTIFALLNGFIHFWVDFTTSKITSRLYEKEKYRAFFNVIGFDQLIHVTTLIISFNYLNNIVV